MGKCWGFSVTVASGVCVTGGYQFTGPEVQQGGFRTGTPSEDWVREIWILFPSSLHKIFFEARLNYPSLLRSDTELFTAGLESLPVSVLSGLGNSCFHNVWVVVEQTAEFLALLLQDRKNGN